MNGSETVQLGEVAEFVRGITFKPEDVVPLGTLESVACMRTKNVQRELDVSDVWAVPTRIVKRQNQYLQPGDILVSSANSWNLIGKCSWISALPWKASFGGFVTVLRADGRRIDPRYLFHWFSSSPVQATLRSFGNQTTNISNLDLARSRALRLPLPSLAEQRRIAEVLDRAEALRGMQRTALKLFGYFAQSLFVSLFSDPVSNPRGWGMKRLDEVGVLDRGVSKHRPRNAPELLGGKYPLIQTGDVANCDGYIREFSSTYSEVGLRQSKLWPAGTLCITIAANIAKTGILMFPACFPDSVVGFRASDTATVEYVRVWLSFLQKTLEENAPEVAQKNINLAILRALQVPLPPLSLQREFEQRLAVINRIKTAHLARLTQLDALFASLQQRAFRGEL